MQTTSLTNFISANLATHREALLQLNLEYMSWTCDEIAHWFGTSTPAILGMSVEQYVTGALDKVCGEAPPRGAFYLVENGGALAGMGGIRTVREGVCELKRVYVRPAFRGLGLGSAILQRALDDARSYGFTRIVLDSGPFMRAAHRVYRDAGFVDCAPYPEAEVPERLHHDWHFMERDI